MLIVILSVIRIKYIVSTPEKSMLYYSTMSVPKNKQYLDPHKIVIIFCLFVFYLKSATIIQYTIKGRFMSR